MDSAKIIKPTSVYCNDVPVYELAITKKKTDGRGQEQWNFFGYWIMKGFFITITDFYDSIQRIIQN